MIYIDIDENKKIDVKKSFVDKLYYNIVNRVKSKSSKLTIEKFEDKVLIILPNLKNKTLNKLSKYIKENCIFMVCMSDVLLKDNIFMEYIKKENVKIFDGRWLFKILAISEVKYIVENKKEKIEYQEISILSNEISDIIVFMIRNLADKVKIVNVLTNDSYKFRKLEKELYEKNGIIINMNNNYKKSLIKSDIILNFDFSEDELNKYNLPKKACILNFKEHININTKSFDGVNASFYEISMPKKYLKYLLFFKRFNIANLYESFIYKNTNPINVLKELEEDEVKINFLLGKNGKIRKNEYLKMSKKLVN